MASQYKLYVMNHELNSPNGAKRAPYAQIAKSLDGKLVEFNIWPLDSDIENVEFAAHPTAIGSIYSARITKIDAKTNLAFLTLGNFDAVMRLKPKTKSNFNEGQYILAEIISEAFDDKSLRVRYVGDVKTAEKNRPHLYRPAKNLAQYCLDLMQNDPSQLITDDYAFLAAVKNQQQSIGTKTKLADVETSKKDNLSIFERHGLSEQIDILHQKQINLKNGGNVIIEHVAAMTIIDVNSHSYVGTDMVAEVNQQAAQIIFEQLSLRNIGGLVMVDFLKYKQKLEREAFAKYLRDSCLQYAIEMGSFTAFGVAEFKIKRTGKRLDQKILDIANDWKESG